MALLPEPLASRRQCTPIGSWHARRKFRYDAGVPPSKRHQRYRAARTDVMALGRSSGGAKSLYRARQPVQVVIWTRGMCVAVANPTRISVDGFRRAFPKG